MKECTHTPNCEACGKVINAGDACATAMVVEMTYSWDRLGLHRSHVLAVFCRDCFDDDCIHGLVVLDPSGAASPVPLGAIHGH